MAANIYAPFGFQPVGTVGGFNPNFRLSQRKISSAYGTAIFKGDAVQPVVSSATGYIQVAVANTLPLAGVFWGCTYLSTSQGKKIWSPYYPGSDAAADVTAYVIDDPQAEFVVQCTNGPVAQANLWQNVTLVTSVAGNTFTGLSGQAITSPTTTSTLPFQVSGFVQDPTGANGTDITGINNWVRVTFNAEVFRAGITSIS